MTLSNYADENGLPIMDQLSFERMTNDIGKEQFRVWKKSYIVICAWIIQIKKNRRSNKIVFVKLL